MSLSAKKLLKEFIDSLRGAQLHGERARLSLFLQEAQEASAERMLRHLEVDTAEGLVASYRYVLTSARYQDWLNDEQVLTHVFRKILKKLGEEGLANTILAASELTK